MEFGPTITSLYTLLIMRASFKTYISCPRLINHYPDKKLLNTLGVL